MSNAEISDRDKQEARSLTPPEKQEKPWNCCTNPCRSGQEREKKGDFSRKAVSDFFGRNKVATRNIHEDVWHLQCRSEYSNQLYAARKGPPQDRTDLSLNHLYNQFLRLKLWRPDATFTVQLSAPAMKRLQNYRKALRRNGNNAAAAAAAVAVPDKKTVRGDSMLTLAQAVLPSHADHIDTHFSGPGRTIDYILTVIMPWIIQESNSGRMQRPPPIEFLIDDEREGEIVNDPQNNFAQWQALIVAGEGPAKWRSGLKPAGGDPKKKKADPKDASGDLKKRKADRDDESSPPLRWAPSDSSSSDDGAPPNKRRKPNLNDAGSDPEPKDAGSDPEPKDAGGDPKQEDASSDPKKRKADTDDESSPPLRWASSDSSSSDDGAPPNKRRKPNATRAPTARPKPKPKATRPVPTPPLVQTTRRRVAAVRATTRSRKRKAESGDAATTALPRPIKIVKLPLRRIAAAATTTIPASDPTAAPSHDIQGIVFRDPFTPTAARNISPQGLQGAGILAGMAGKPVQVSPRTVISPQRVQGATILAGMAGTPAQVAPRTAISPETARKADLLASTVEAGDSSSSTAEATDEPSLEGLPLSPSRKEAAHAMLGVQKERRRRRQRSRSRERSY